MLDRDDSDQPRKRIAVACGRCRKRKIRCSGDPGNGGPCSNCKNAGHEPCLFLRVSSQETALKETNEYTYNIDAARAYGNPRGAVSSMSPLPQYAHEIAGDGLAAYRQSPYPYKGYYQNMPGWAGTYQDDGSVDYGLSYPSYPIINQEPASPLISGYPATPYNTRKPVYVDAAETAPPYSYGNLVHRPATVVGHSNESQGFSLSSMAASLPRASERLQSSINRTLTGPPSSNYRSEGMPAYQNGKITADAPYSTIQPSFEPPYSTTTTALAPTIAHRATPHADAAYPLTTAATEQQLYAPSSDPSIRSEDPSAGLSYVYSHDCKRDSDSATPTPTPTTTGGCGRSVLSNGHVYVPESQHTATYVVPPSASSRTIEGPPPPAPASSSSSSASASSGTGSVSGNTSNTSTSTSAGASTGDPQRHREDAHRRSAGSLRGGSATA